MAEKQPTTPTTTSNNGNGVAVASLVLGIVSVVFSFVYLYVGLITGIVGIVLAVKGRREATADKKGMATAGLVLSIIGTSLSAVLFLCAVCALGALSSIANS